MLKQQHHTLKKVKVWKSIIGHLKDIKDVLFKYNTKSYLYRLRFRWLWVAVGAWTYTAVRGSKSHGSWSDMKHLGSCISTSNNSSWQRYGVNSEHFLYHYPPAWMQLGLHLFLFLIKTEGHKDSVIMTSLFRSSYIMFGRERKIQTARERTGCILSVVQIRTVPA